MNRCHLIGAAMLAAVLNFAGFAHAEQRFFVSTTGNDAGSGTLADPNESATDGPFATIHRGQQAVRDLLATGDAHEPIVVLIRGGFYELAEPIVFTPADSGTKETPVTYAAYGDEQPILSGGRRITGWTITKDGAWRTTLPEVAAGEWSFSQLWIDGERRFRPALPAEEYFRVEREVEPTEASAGKGHDRFGYTQGDINPDWENLGDVEVLAIHIWSASRMRIADVDTENNIVTFTGCTRTSSAWGRFPAHGRYRIINVKEALTQAGQWYLDRPTGILTYLPRNGESPENTMVIAPRLETLVRFEGDIARNRPVRHVSLEGLTFAHANWTLRHEGQSFPQAEVNLSAAIEAAGAEHVNIRNCAVTHVGQYAVALGPACRHVMLDGCELTDLGAGGVKIGLGGGAQSWMIGNADPDNPDHQVNHNTVRDCLIAHGGRLHPAAVGVWIGHASHSLIEHNDIFDFYYTGISIGWTWGYREPSRSHHNEIAYNQIHTIGQGVLSDMSGVYTLGVSPGTSVHHNIIHDVRSFDYGGWGLYTDEGSTGIAMHHNLVYRTTTGGFHQHYGKENSITNNIFAESARGQIQRTRTENHLSFTFERNIVYWTNDSPLLSSNWRDDNFNLDHNLYWNPQAEAIQFPGGLTLQQWREQRGKPLHSVITDPQFVNPANDDYRLNENSPAPALGFEPWDYTEAGRRIAYPREETDR